MTHTVVPEKYRLRDDNKRVVFKTPTGSCLGPSGHVSVSDIMNGKVYKVQANHYPANEMIEMDCLEHPIAIGIAVFKDVLYCAKSKKEAKDAIASKT